MTDERLDAIARHAKIAVKDLTGCWTVLGAPSVFLKPDVCLELIDEIKRLRSELTDARQLFTEQLSENAKLLEELERYTCLEKVRMLC